MNIGNFALSSPLLLAPMAGITDLPFRVLNRHFGCQLAFAEMISARALTYRNSNTLKMLSTNTADRPIGMQLLGSDPSIMIKAMEVLRDYEFDLLDINAACPVSKVTKRGEGAGLLKEPRRFFEVLKAVVANSHWPVTVKIRAGWDEFSVNACDISLTAQEAGVDAVFIHGRTQEQGYSGSVDYEIIRKVKAALAIPVIASGDALSPELIKKLFDETGCDAVAIARGALGNPWIFCEAAQYLKDGTLPPRPDINDIIETMIMHLDLSVEADGDENGTTKFRKFFAWYVRGLHDTRNIRTEAFRATTREQMIGFINQIRDSYYRTGFSNIQT